MGWTPKDLETAVDVFVEAKRRLLEKISANGVALGEVTFVKGGPDDDCVAIVHCLGPTASSVYDDAMEVVGMVKSKDDLTVNGLVIAAPRGLGFVSHTIGNDALAAAAMDAKNAAMAHLKSGGIQ